MLRCDVRVDDSQVEASGSLVCVAGQIIEIRPFADDTDFLIKFEISAKRGITQPIFRLDTMTGKVLIYKIDWDLNISPDVIGVKEAIGFDDKLQYYITCAIRFFGAMEGEAFTFNYAIYSEPR